MALYILLDDITYEKLEEFRLLIILNHRLILIIVLNLRFSRNLKLSSLILFIALLQLFVKVITFLCHIL